MILSSPPFGRSRCFVLFCVFCCVVSGVCTDCGGGCGVGLCLAPMRVILLLAAFACASAVKPATLSGALPKFNAAIGNSSVSGLSSGAFFAVQMHIAYSATIKSVAVFAGGPYDCAAGQEMNALMECMEALPSPPSPASSILTTDIRASSGSIDATSNIAPAYVYMYSGTKDTTVNPKVMDALYQYYINYIPAAQVLFGRCDHIIIMSYHHSILYINPITVIWWCGGGGGGDVMQ